MVLINTKEQVMQKIICTIEILINPLIVFQTEILFWVVVVISETWKYKKKKVKMNNKKIQSYSIFLDTYRSAQIMASSPLNMVRHVVSAKNYSQIIKEVNIYKQGIRNYWRTDT